jgi:hypothetical protein
MSHADGLAILANGEMFHFEYDGTMDRCCTRLYIDYEEMHANWRTRENCQECTCEEKKYSQVMLSTSYGSWGFLWESEICKACMCIVGKTHDWKY